MVEEWVRVRLPAEEFLKGDGVLWGHGVVTVSPPLGPEPLRAIVHVDLAWTSQFALLPKTVNVFESEFGLFRDTFKFRDLCMPHSINILLIFHHVDTTHQLVQGVPH